MSELRKDLVSGEWIIVAPERAKRPHDGREAKEPRVPASRETCPFEDLEKSGNWPPYALVPEGADWRVAVIPNKYPALTHSGKCATIVTEGPYEHADGMGFSDLLIFRDHEKGLDALENKELALAFEALQERCRVLGADPCMLYISAYFNWGVTAGASLSHPHMQIAGLPIVPPDVLQSLKGSQMYYEAHARCAHCDMIAYEKGHATRIVFENEGAIALAPFASHQPFEVKIYPKRHVAEFPESSKEDIAAVTDALAASLAGMKKYLNDPDLNFFIHSAPVKRGEGYPHYHWHLGIVPKTSVQAGFEIGTGVLINVVDPDHAAQILRGG